MRSFFAANSKENFFWATKQWEKIDKDSQYHYQFVKKIINDKLEGYDEIVIDYLNAPLSQNIHPIKDVICTAFELIIKSNDYPTIIEWAINPPETISLVPSQKKKLMTRAIVLIESKKKFVRINELLKSLINYYNEYPETYNGSILIKFFSKVYEFQSLNLSLDHKIFLITNILKSIKTLKKYDPLVEKNFNTLLYTTLEEFSQDSSKQDNYFSFSLLLIEWVVNHPEITSLELKNIKHPLQCALAMIFNTKKHNFIKLGQFFIPILNHHQKSSQLISLKKVIQFLNKIPDISSIQINIDNKIFLVDQIIKNMNLFGKKSTQAQQNFQKLVASILTEFSEDRVKNEKCRSLIIQIIDLATKNKLFHIPEIFTDSIELNLFSKSVNIENLNSYVTALQKYYPNNLQKTVRLLDKITDKKITDLKFNIKKSVVKHLLENLDVFENNHAQAKQNLQRLTRSLLIYFSNDKNKQVENHELFELIKINSIKILAYNYSSSDTDDLVASVMCKIGSFYDELEPPTRNGYEILYENALIFSQVNQHMSSDQFFLTLKALLKLYLYLPFSNNSSFDHKSIGCLDNLLLYNSVDSATSICKFLSVLLHYTLQSRRLDTYTDNSVNDLINLITIKVTNIVATEKKISAQFEIIIKQIYQILSLDYLSNKNRLDDKYSTNINTLNALDKIIHKKKKDISLMNRWISDRNKLLTEGIKLNLECDILKLYYLVDDEFAKIQNIISFSNKLTRMIEYGEFVQTPNLIKYLTISSTQLDESTWKKIFLIFLPVFLKVYLKVENQPDYISKILNSFLKDLSNSVTSDQRGLVSSRIEQANQYFNLMENSIDEFNKLLAKEKIDTIINLIILQIFGPNIDLK